MGKKFKGVTIHFMPHNEIERLSSADRIKKLLKIILDNKGKNGGKAKVRCKSTIYIDPDVDYVHFPVIIGYNFPYEIKISKEIRLIGSRDFTW